MKNNGRAKHLASDFFNISLILYILTLQIKFKIKVEFLLFDLYMAAMLIKLVTLIMNWVSIMLKINQN